MKDRSSPPGTAPAALLVALMFAGGCVVASAAHEALEKQVSSVKVHGQNLRPIKVVLPRYPTALKDSRAEGEAEVAYLITELGDVIQVKTLRATRDEFAFAAQEAISQWRFEPIVVDGKARSQRARITIKFRPGMGQP